jgi:hypothetical protein
MSIKEELIKKKIIKEKLLERESIDTLQQANDFMDRVTNRLSDNDLKRAYEKAKEKLKRKPNDKNKQYMANYFRTALEKRGYKYD